MIAGPDLKPDLGTDFLVWPRTCLITMILPYNLSSWLDLALAPAHLADPAGCAIVLVSPSGRTGGNGHKPKYRRFPLNIRKQVFFCEGDQALAQVA